MIKMQPFPIPVLTEADFDSIVEKAGGFRAHPDSDQRKKVGADYLLGRAVIELKMLNEEGFGKPERQAKLAELFLSLDSKRSVVVLDQRKLPSDAQYKYRRIIEGPIKTAIAKAKDQLSQSRSELPDAAGSVIWIVNNGYTALDHEMLKELVVNRIHQDTRSIDGIIVSGCYYHSDGFDSFFIWPIEYVPISLDFNFEDFERVKSAFHNFSESFMTRIAQQNFLDGRKIAVKDVVFDVNNIRFIQPAPSIGFASDFYALGRPRTNSSNLTRCPPVAVVVPDLKFKDFESIRLAVGDNIGPLSSSESWSIHLKKAAASALPIKPLVKIPVVTEVWLRWCLESDLSPSMSALNKYVLDEFNRRIRVFINTTRELKGEGILASRYILAVTEEIGQDRANDVSHIASIREQIDGRQNVQPFVENLRIFHEHAITLACSYALSEGIDVVYWKKDRQYCWR